MIAFVFPGQGSQRLRLGAPFVDDPAWKLAVRARELTGVDVPRLLLDADDATLRETRHAQLVVATHALMSLRVARRHGFWAEATAGHSVGEIAALVAGGVLSEEDALRLVAARGRAMAAACKTTRGGMLAVSADRTTAERLVASVGLGVWLAAVNAPGQVVVAGEDAALHAFERIAREAGVRARRLEVSGAFHTPLMQPARPPLERTLGSVRLGAARVPIASNADGLLREEADWPRLLLEQLVRPVLWQACVENLVDAGVTKFVEFGAAPTLGGLIRRTAPEAVCLHARSPAEIEDLPSSVVARAGADMTRR